MRTCLAGLLAVFAVLLFGCGGSDETATSATTGDRRGDEASQAPREPDYPLPKLPSKRPPLKKLYIKDLKVGKGPAARWGDEVLTRYVAVYWKTGKIFTVEWGRESELFHFDLDPNGAAPGWQRGLHGMRVGGWRELRIPSDLLYNGGDAAYIVTLVKVNPGGSK